MSVIIPKQTFDVEIEVEEVINLCDGALVLSFEVEGFGPNDGFLILDLAATGTLLAGMISNGALVSSFLSSGAGLTGRVGNAALELEIATDGYGLTGNVWSAELQLPSMAVTGSAMGGSVSDGACSLSLETAGSGLSGNAASGDLEIRIGASDGQGWTEIVCQGEFFLPPFVVEGHAAQTLEEAYRGVAINLLNRAISEYEAFEFNSACLFNGKHLGASGDGIHILEGDMDDTTAIDAEIRTGVALDPRAPEKKRVPEAFLSVKTDGGFIFGTITDSNYRKEYTAREDGKTSMHNGKVQLGRGILSNYWGATFRNHKGSDFELQSIELISNAGKRL